MLARRIIPKVKSALYFYLVYGSTIRTIVVRLKGKVPLAAILRIIARFKKNAWYMKYYFIKNAPAALQQFILLYYAEHTFTVLGTKKAL